MTKICEEYLGKDSGYLMYRIVDALVDYCFPMVNKTLSNLDEIEDKVFDDKVSASHDVAILRRDIASQRRIIGPIKGVVADLERKAQRFTQADLKVYFGDINDHLARLWSNLDECQESIEIYKDTDFLLSQERTNRILALLTIVFTISYPCYGDWCLLWDEYQSARRDRDWGLDSLGHLHYFHNYSSRVAVARS